MQNRLVIYFLFAVMLSACAQIRSIPGGEKDLAPPLVKEAYPPPMTTQFRGNMITLQFDEYVQLNNIYQELVISPPLERQPKIRVRKRAVIIEFQEELQPESTYLLNFGDGIVDVNEGNKAQDLFYVFGTGSEIDSLALAGTVMNAALDAPAAGYKVMLFENDTTVFSKKSVPLYLTRTHEDGRFQFRHLRAGDFYLYALDDQNSNYRWDEGEAIAMMDSLISTGPDSVGVSLVSSIPRPLTPLITGYEVDSVGMIVFPLDETFREVNATTLDGRPLLRHWENDSMHVWLPGLPTDRKEGVRISWKNELSDTLDVPFFAEAQRQPMTLRISSGKKIKPRETIRIWSESLMQLANPSGISLTADSIPLHVTVIPDSIGFRFTMESQFKAGNTCELRILPGTFTNNAGGTNDTLATAFSVYEPSELGSLEFSFSDVPEGIPLIFFLRDRNGDVVFEGALRDKEIKITDLPAGDYAAEILEDQNGNGNFDPVIIRSKTPPEKVHVHDGKITVRANWEVKIDWPLLD